MDESREVAQLIDDLHYIKEAVKRNRPLARETFSSVNFRFVALIFGIGAIAVSLFAHFLIAAFGSFSEIPVTWKALWSVSIAVACAFVGLSKILTIMRSVKKASNRLGMFALYRELYMTATLHVYLPILAVGIGAMVFLALTGKSYYIIGAAGLTAGLLMNVMGSTVRIGAYFAIGYWFMATGALSLILPVLPGAIWSAICYGGGCLLFVIVNDIQSRAERRR